MKPNNFFRNAGLVLFRAQIITGLILGICALYAMKRHVEAKYFLSQIDLGARHSSGASFYASKKKLFVGQRLSLTDVRKHLESTNFVLSDDSTVPGSYSVSGGDILEITPRLPEFQPVTIKFSRDRISRIDVSPTQLNPTSGEVADTTIEPVPLGALILSIDGDEHSKMFVRRYTVQFADFEQTDLFTAVLASEDTLFMQHNGTRFDRVVVNMLPGRTAGGSSITAQVIKNAVSLDKTHAVTRKIDELFLASALEQQLSKEDILTLYVNNVFLGGGKGSPNVYGFLAAAEEYFGKRSIADLTLDETCTLVAMLPQPNAFLNQVKRDEYHKLTASRNRVLRRLNESWPNKYPRELVEAAQQTPLRFVSRPYVEQPLDVLSRQFVDYATSKQPLIDLESLPPTEYSGLHFFTSIDPDLTQAAQRILSERIPLIERRFPALQPNGCDGQPDRLLGAIVAVNPESGEIVVMSGGAGGKDSVKYAKLALNAREAPASTIKPLWIALALAEGTIAGGARYTGASVLDPANASLEGWTPRMGLHGAGRPRTKLAVSADDYFVHTLGLIGIEKGKSFFEHLTGNSVTNPSGQFALGFGAGTEVSPLSWTKAFTIFNNGSMTDLRPISQVYLDGKEITFNTRAPIKMVDPGAAYVTTQMMRSVLGFGLDGIHGTGRRAFSSTGLDPNRLEMAGKTGSGPSGVWMVSVSPKLVVAVLLTYQCHSQIKNARLMYSTDTAAVIWAAFIKAVQKYQPDLISGRFQRPANVREVRINPETGCQSANGINEFFIDGTVPSPCR
jgi:penicillin-binding protein 2A